jgi:Fibronectin type III domain/Divergent InlB B-repeat domain
VFFRRDAAALCVTAMLLAVGLFALPAGPGVGAQAADVSLQVVPRGPGTVTSSVPDKTSGETACTNRSEPGACEWTFSQGSTIVLTASPNGSDASFAGWSVPDCPSTGTCSLTLDDDQSVTALFSKLTLDVSLSGDNDDERVTSTPAGIDCPRVCQFDFDARSTVNLTVDPGSSTLTSFPFGCSSVDGNVCHVTMLDDPQTVGVQFNNAGGPDEPALVQVSLRVRKTGDGGGRVTATGLDCGGTCSAKFKYGKLEPFTAVVDSGSLFGGWGGVCASDKDLRCTLPMGPITVIHPRFVKEAPPSAPGPLKVSSATESSITLTWGASTDDTGVKRYDVFVGAESAPRASTSSTTATLTGLVCGTSYSVAVQAVDGAGNRSPKATGQLSTTACPLRVQFLGAKIVRAKGVKRLVVRLKSSAATRGSGMLFVNGKRILRIGVVLKMGTNRLSYRMPKGSGRRRVRLQLRLADPKGGVKALTYRMTVRM